jgi:hypothetical protein
MSEQEERGNPEKQSVQVVLARIEKKSDITLFIAILTLAVAPGIAAAVAPQAIAGLFMVVFVGAASVGIVGLPILFVYNAFRGRRTEEGDDEAPEPEPAVDPEP